MNKKEQINEIKSLLKKDDKNNLKDIEYVEEKGEEYALIKLNGAFGSGRIKLNVTGNSFAANILAITKAIYF